MNSKLHLAEKTFARDRKKKPQGMRVMHKDRLRGQC